MLLILTCRDCKRTSATSERIETMSSPRQESWLVWGCTFCRRNHRWTIPEGKGVIDTARQSLKHSSAFTKSAGRSDIYAKLSAASPKTRQKILLGELIWWWREEANLNQKDAAKVANISTRQLKRLEDGQNQPHPRNLKLIIKVVQGSIEQVYLITKADKLWEQDFALRMIELNERISPTACVQIDPAGWALSPSIIPDLDFALGELKRVLPAEPNEDKFLFMAHAIHQAYWIRLLGGPITIDDDRAKIIPPVKKLADLLERCDSKESQYRVIYEMVQCAEMFLTKPELADFVTYFLLRSFSSEAGEHETRRRIKDEWEQATAKERLILTLFDLIDPQYQSQLIATCRKLNASERQTEVWFKD